MQRIPSLAMSRFAAVRTQVARMSNIPPKGGPQFNNQSKPVHPLLAVAGVVGGVGVLIGVEQYTGVRFGKHGTGRIQPPAPQPPSSRPKSD